MDECGEDENTPDQGEGRITASKTRQKSAFSSSSVAVHTSLSMWQIAILTANFYKSLKLSYLHKIM